MTRNNECEAYIHEVRISKVRKEYRDEGKIFTEVDNFLKNQIETSNESTHTFFKQKWQDAKYKNVSVKIRYAIFAWMYYDEKAIIEDNSWFNLLNILDLKEDFNAISSEYKSINTHRYNQPS